VPAFFCKCRSNDLTVLLVDFVAYGAIVTLAFGGFGVGRQGDLPIKKKLSDYFIQRPPALRTRQSMAKSEMRIEAG